jgi:RNA polymerase sigma-70 factor (ECF subfamily)
METLSPLSSGIVPVMTELARRAMSDDAALGALYDAFATRLHGYARALVRTEHDADEALQDAFLGLVGHRRGLAAVENPSAYLFRSVRNAALAISRRATRAPRRSLDEVPEPFVEAVDSSGAASEDEVNALLSGLPAEQREVVVLKVYAELTFQEIADLLEISINTAASRWRYAAETLRAGRGGHP